MIKNFVSIIATFHNQSKKVCTAIDSVLAQTWVDYELILIDDASTDDTLQQVQQSYGHLEHLMYLCNETRLGIHECRNVGVSYANGEYIAFLDIDLLWAPDKLEKQMAQILSPNSGNTAVYSSYATIENEVTTEFPPESVPMECRSGNMYPCVLDKDIIPIGTLLMTREAWNAIGGFNIEFPALQEYEFTIRLAQYAYIDYIPRLLALTYSNSKSKHTLHLQEEILAQCSLFKMHYDNLLTFGLVDKKLHDLYQEIPRYKRKIFFQYLEQIEHKKVRNFLLEKKKLLDTSNRPYHISGNIQEIKDCTGCMACYAACPTGAIVQQYNHEGFFFPSIHEKDCTQCGKCIEVCPLCNSIPGTTTPEECYAVMAEDEIRMKASSGGIFPILAKYILEQGGYVAGVILTEDFTAKHIVTNHMEDVEAMFGSKYLQSDVGNVYAEIKQLLEDNETILFSGCACQVAALHTFLNKKEYPNLFTIDVVCHGVPSPKVFQNYAEEQTSLVRVSFRDKTAFGWDAGLCSWDADGNQKVEPGSENPYMFAFLNNWILRESCYDCHFKGRRYSDITIGDFWGINTFAPFDDGLGTSVVMLNTTKGRSFFRTVQNTIQPALKKLAQVPKLAATRFNPCIETSTRQPRFRAEFFKHYQKDSLEQSIIRTKNAIHFDVALVLMWAENYGNALTNYALYTYLKNEGYRVLALNNFGPRVLRPKGVMGDFAAKNYQLSADFFREDDAKELNDACDCFIVGSDQNWNYHWQEKWHLGNYFYLDFVEDDKKKLSFGTSFGNSSVFMPKEQGIPLFQRFDAVSSREEAGVYLCRNMYGIDAQKVIDPVFLLEQKDYEIVAARSDCYEEEPFFMTYILSPTPEKRKLCLKMQEQLGGIKMINILDCNPENEQYNRIMMEFDNIKCQIPLEDMLYYIQHSQYIITDSFHGTCFSIIFRKPFLAIRNYPKHRFQTFDKYAPLADRIIEENATWHTTTWLKPIDYDSIYKTLHQEIMESKEFIKKYLK